MKSVLLAVAVVVVMAVSGCSAIVIDEQQTAGTGGSGGQVADKALEVMSSPINPSSAKVCWGSAVSVLAADLAASGADAPVDEVTITVIHGDATRIVSATAVVQSSGSPDQEVSLEVVGNELVGVDGFVAPIGETATITVVVTLGTPDSAGQDDYRFGIAGASAISTVDGRMVSGEFPLVSGTFTAYQAAAGETCSMP